MLTRLGRRFRLRGRRDDERGAIMVMTILTMSVMLGISALVIDLGHGMEKRRQLENTADAAALAAAQDLPFTGTAEATAKTVASQNAPDATFTWSTCTDNGVLAVTTPDTNCISFDSSFTRARVRIPQQSYKSLFASILGRNTVSTTGAATARVVSAGFGSIEPFALFSGFNAGLSCLKEGPSGHRIASCDDPSTGNFNLLDITQYGNATLNTPQRCGNSFQRQRMIDNIAIGADHLFSVYTGTELDDGCGQPGPNTLPPRTGNDISAFDTGLVHGAASDTSDGGAARLKRGQYPKATVMGVPLDNKPLWEFIPDTTLSNVPTSCQRATFKTLLATSYPTPAQEETTLQAALEQCFTDYEAGNYTGVVFGANTNPFGAESPVDLYDIQLSPRFAYVPEFVQSVPPNGSSSNLNIAEFRAIYMEDTYAGCSSGCSVDFAPGPWNTTPLGAGNQNAEAMTAWVFPPTMLPIGLRGNPAAVGQNTYVQLVK
jgi:Flp pilus assembly protein TadG